MLSGGSFVIKKISILLTALISKNKPLDEKERAIYEYCIRIIIKRCFFIFLLLLFGLLSKRTIISIIFLTTFIPLRAFCGGMHASTPTICSILSYGISLSTIFFSPLIGKSIPYTLILCLFTIFFIPIILFAPVDAENKRLSIKQKHSLKIKCLIFSFIMGMEFVVFSVIQAKVYCMTISLCVIICSISIVIGFIHNRRNSNES